MLTKNDFSAPDWNTLRDTQYLVGFAMVVAGSSGLGTIKELAALSHQIIQNQASGVPLIRDLTATSEMQAAQASLKQSFGGQEAKPSSDSVRRLALDGARSSLAILGSEGQQIGPERKKRRTLTPGVSANPQRNAATPAEGLS